MKMSLKSSESAHVFRPENSWVLHGAPDRLEQPLLVTWEDSAKWQIIGRMVCAENNRPGGICILDDQLDLFQHIDGIGDKLEFPPFHHGIKDCSRNDHERQGR